MPLVSTQSTRTVWPADSHVHGPCFTMKMYRLPCQPSAVERQASCNLHFHVPSQLAQIPPKRYNLKVDEYDRTEVHSTAIAACKIQDVSMQSGFMRTSRLRLFFCPNSTAFKFVSSFAFPRSHTVISYLQSFIAVNAPEALISRRRLRPQLNRWWPYRRSSAAFVWKFQTNQLEESGWSGIPAT